MVAARIEAKGLDKAQKRLAEMIERAKNLAPVLAPIAAAIKTDIDNSFRRSAGPDGEGWEPLSQATVAGRRGRSNVPLVDTGTMRNAAYAEVDGNSIVFGDNVSYVGTHQFGAEIQGSYKVGPKQRTGPKLGPVSPVRRKAAKKSRKTKLGPRTMATGYAAPIGPRWQNNNQRAAQQGGSYTIKIPRRPFLPINPDGSLMKTPSITKLNEQVIEYIRSGKKPGR